MVYLTEADVLRFLSMRDCIDLMRRLFTSEYLNQPRRRLTLPTKSTLHDMAGAWGGYFGAKVYSTNPRHAPHFLFLLYRAEDAELLAVIEANHLGQIRTGAASGYATQLLARPESRTLAVIGSGFQARTQVEAIRTAMPGVERVRIWSRSAEKREAFARDVGGETCASAEETVRGADILVTATNSGEPVVEADWVGAGTHINAMGSNQARRRELPEELVRKVDVMVADSIEQSRIEAGDLLLGLSDDDWTRVVELRDVAAGRAGRTRPDQLTMFKSLGLAVEDVAAAGWVYERAREAGAGRSIYS
jgi:alanine dehydrogenase